MTIQEFLPEEEPIAPPQGEGDGMWEEDEVWEEELSTDECGEEGEEEGSMMGEGDEESGEGEGEEESEEQSGEESGMGNVNGNMELFIPILVLCTICMEVVPGSTRADHLRVVHNMY